MLSIASHVKKIKPLLTEHTNSCRKSSFLDFARAIMKNLNVNYSTMYGCQLCKAKLCLPCIEP